MIKIMKQRRARVNWRMVAYYAVVITLILATSLALVVLCYLIAMGDIQAG